CQWGFVVILISGENGLEDGLHGRVDVNTQVDDADDDHATNAAQAEPQEPVKPIVDVHQQEKEDGEDRIDGYHDDEAELVSPLRPLDALQSSHPYPIDVRR